MPHLTAIGVTCGECVYDMLGGVYEVVEVVGAWDGEIMHGRWFWPAKYKMELCQLGFGLGCTNLSAGHRMGM